VNCLQKRFIPSILLKYILINQLENEMLEYLEPKPVWNYFEQFCTIPHPSGYESQATQFIIDTAKKLGLTAITDSTGNVLIKKEATDAAKKETVILQCHLDMVPQKNAGTIHDFKKDPIRPILDGNWVKAQGTTLGADNGIGVATALAIIESKSIRHGPIEALFTIDEERGMTGAFGLTDDFVTGRTLINLDTENEYEICIGCAGGTDVIADLPMQFESFDTRRCAFEVTVNGLQGGHSGMEIHLGRANALKLLCHILSALPVELDIGISTLHGGTARNAIPREAFAVVSVPKQQVDLLIKSISRAESSFCNEFATTDPGLRINCSATDRPMRTIDKTSIHQLLAAISECPNGVLQMSSNMPGIVETSNNCAIIKEKDDSFQIDCMLRSSNEPELLSLKKRITAIFKQYGASVTYGSGYPGWKPAPHSPLLAIMKKAYATVHNVSPEIVSVHAGLECGIISGKFTSIDMVSCGPTIRFAHSPDEQMFIPSVDRFWRCIVAVLEMID
jgi:dipeptidase D